MKLSEEKIEERFKKLIGEGKSMLNKSGWNGQKYSNGNPSKIDYQKWRVQVVNLIERVCGKESIHYKMINDIAKDAKSNSYYLKEYYGILQGAYIDYSDEMLINIRHLIRADLLDDLLSQAEQLLEKNYYIPAASLGGALLEDALRKLCDDYNIDYPKDTSINSLNTQLYNEKVYNKLKFKEITAKADIRNNADHGKFDCFKYEDVDDMLNWIRRFVSDYLV